MSTIGPTAAPSNLPAVTLPTPAELRAAVRRFIGSRVPNPATADDLTQDVLLKVHQRLPQVRDPLRLMGWVIQIARNAIADFYRSARSTETFDETHLPAQPEPLAPFENEESQLRKDLARYLRSVVQALPPANREAIIHTEFDGVPQIELARRLGLSASAVKSRVQRGRAMMRAIVDRCCEFELDAYGTVLDYRPKPQGCHCSTTFSPPNQPPPPHFGAKASL